MKELLHFSIVVEPDLQRLARFTIDTVQALDGNCFRATNALANIMPRLREDALKSIDHIQTRLLLTEDTLSLVWGNNCEPIEILPTLPTDEDLRSLTAHLHEASESTDPELLIRRNRRFSADLEKAREQAAIDLAELEQVLEKKKQELQESIEHAETDSLTGLFNRGAFDSRLRDIFMRSQRQNEPLSLIMLDLDNFKQINDSQGHQFGDEYLKHLARSMIMASREHVDYSCRMGGDEFAIIAGTHQTHAQRIAAKVLKKMNNKVSIGIAQMKHNDTVESLIGRADAALYQAKRNGRGQLMVADNKVAKNPEKPGKKTAGAKTSEVIG